MTTPTRHMKVWLRSALGVGAAVATASAVAIGCGSSTTTTTDGGTPVTDATVDTGTTPVDAGTASETSTVHDSGPANETSTTTDAGAADAGSLYSRLGGHAGIRMAVDAVIAKETANQDIASYFFFQGGAPGNGHPTPDQIAECFTDLVGSVSGGTETYPATVTDDAGSFTCRAMTTIHAPLLISGGTFDEFIMIAAAELALLNVSSADIGTLGTVLVGTKPQIVTASLADAGLEPYPGDGGEAPDAFQGEAGGGEAGGGEAGASEAGAGEAGASDASGD